MPPANRDGYYRRLPKRVDKNQAAIVKTLRRVGWMVFPLHETGAGMYDLLAAKHGFNILCEVKDGTKPPSARELTPAQKRFNFSWAGMRCVLTCNADCLKLDAQINSMAAIARHSGMKLEVTGCNERQYAPGLYCPAKKRR